jgi:hypothetical protein
MRIGAIFIFLAALSSAAELKTETLAAWDDYSSGVNRAMLNRLGADHTFLWIDEQSARSTQVREGKILGVPAAPHVPHRVPNGLIHHWIGAAFIPAASLDDVLDVLRDYSQYKEYFHPTILDSNSVRRSDAEDRYSLVVMNKAVLVRTAIDTDVRTRYVRVDRHRAYGFSEATRIQEIQNFGLDTERKLPPDQGNGYLWRLGSVTRLQERDGGVYIEVEALALSRDVPAAFRLIVDPVVRRVSRNSMLVSLKQTQDAVSAHRAKSGPAEHAFLPR